MKRTSILDEQCPTESFTPGSPTGEQNTGCWGDGHYECKNCELYRADFKRNGQEYIDFVHHMNKNRVYIYAMPK